MRLFLFAFWSIILLFGCGSDESEELVSAKPSYFPDTIGSRWVYRTVADGEWVWLVDSEKTVDDKNYQRLEKTPGIAGTEFELLLPTFYRVSQNRILFSIGEKIEHYVQTELPIAVQDEFAGLEVEVVIDSISYPELIFFEEPLTSNSEWDALNVNVSGNFILQNILLLNIPFEVNFKVKGEVIGAVPIETAAGKFDNTYQIKYQIEITQNVFSTEESTKRSQTIWFVPHVGIVKIEDENGVTELLEYTLASKTKT